MTSATTCILPFAFDGVTNLNDHIPTLRKEGTRAIGKSPQERVLSHLEVYPALRASVSTRNGESGIEDDEEA